MPHSFALNLYKQFNVIFVIQEHSFHSSNRATSTVTVHTDLFVLFVIFLVPKGFFPYMRFTVHIRMVKYTARTSLTEALILRTAPDFNCFTSHLNF